MDVVDVVIRCCSPSGAAALKLSPGYRPALLVATRQSSRYFDGSCMKQGSDRGVGGSAARACL